MSKIYRQSSAAAGPESAKYGDLDVKKDGRLSVADENGALVAVAKQEEALNAPNALKLGGVPPWGTMQERGVLSGGIDWNGTTNTGIYYISAATNPLPNMAAYGLLVVFATGGYKIQMFVEASLSGGNMAYRMADSANTWSAWHHGVGSDTGTYRSGNFNDFVKPGVFYCTGDFTNGPGGAIYGLLEVTNGNSGYYVSQMLKISNGNIWSRFKASTAWTPWVKWAKA